MTQQYMQLQAVIYNQKQPVQRMFGWELRKNRALLVMTVVQVRFPASLLQISQSLAVVVVAVSQDEVDTLEIEVG